ncbi:MAG TPA: hypothetical protein VMG37_11575 [Solirubrobacteraceae bacterium]|nr:hypothetical protein [Solirubrobacteraceae bacterium]
MAAEPQTSNVSDIGLLRAAIDRAAAATEVTLAGHRPSSADDDSRPLAERLAEHTELSRQLGALRDRVALAEGRNEGPLALRAELATLLSFAGTLQADADRWRAAGEELEKELERQRASERKERQCRVVEREKLKGRRDALQSTILQTGSRMAQQYRGECRRTVPVFSLGEGLTVCSVSVSCPRRGLRFARLWLVTLTGSHDVLVRRE